MVWQKANRSATSPWADSIRLFAAVSGSAQDAIERRIVPFVGRLLGDLSLEEGHGLGFAALGDGKQCRIRLGAGVHQQVGQHGRLVAGVVGQDVGGEGPLGVGTLLVPEGRGQRARSRSRIGRRVSSKRRIITGVLDHRLEQRSVMKPDSR